METKKKKRGRPPKHKTTETTGMTFDGAIKFIVLTYISVLHQKSIFVFVYLHIPYILQQ